MSGTYETYATASTKSAHLHYAQDMSIGALARLQEPPIHEAASSDRQALTSALHPPNCPQWLRDSLALAQRASELLS